MVMTTGIGAPFSIFWVWALNALQNSMMLRPRWPSAGPIGGAGFAAPAGTCNFRYPVTFFAIYHSSCCFRTSPKTSQDRGAVRMTAGDRQSPSTALHPSPRACRERETVRSDFLDLTEFQFDRRGATEDRNRDLDARAPLVDFLDDAGERSERPIGHPHVLADLERHRRLRTFHTFLHLVQDPHGLGLRDRHRLVFRAEEARHLRGVLDQMEGLVGQLHLDQDIAREKLAFGVDLAAAAHLGDLFGRHQHLLEQFVEPALLRLLADRVRDLLFEIRIGVDDIPALVHQFSSGACHQWMPSKKVTRKRMS